MKTTLNLDDEWVERAEKITGIKESSQLLREALIALVQRESAKRLAELGASEPQLEHIPRNQANDE
ncbi:MAG: hypothetical protein RLZZ09_1038 [Pseudomonadota bacterium]|jgi:hypothetical protein